jgi:hypothetical protein
MESVKVVLGNQVRIDKLWNTALLAIKKLVIHVAETQPVLTTQTTNLILNNP